MKRYTRSARIWIVSNIVAAIIATAILLRPHPPSRSAFFAFLILAVCAAIAHFFPIRSLTHQATYSLTNIFIIAGAIILPLPLVSALILAALTPQSVQSRHRPGVIARWSFNVAQTLLAAYALHGIIAYFGIGDRNSSFDGIVLTAGAILFLLVQNFIVAIAMVCNTHIALKRTEILQPTALVTEGFYGFLGVIAAILWLTTPFLLILLIPVLFIAHAFTRTAQLAELALHDAKTGLPNARSFERTLDTTLERAFHAKQSFAVLFIDLDHFKAVNDLHGHAAGDAVLREVSALLQATLRREDTVARFGGEEFVALLPDITTDTAARLAERLRAAIATHEFLHDRAIPVACTASIGMVIYPRDGADAATLLDYADRAMYQAKHTRNATYVGDDLRPIAQLPAAPAHGGDASWRDRLRVRFPSPPALLLAATVFCGSIALAIALVTIWRDDAWLVVLPCVVVGVVSDLFPVRLYAAKEEKMTVTLTDAAVMALVTIHPLAAPVVPVAAALVHVITGKQQRLDKILFNLTNPGLAAGFAGGVYLLLRPDSPGFTVRHLSAAFVSSVVFVIANSGIVALMISLHSHRPLRTVLRQLFWYAPITLLLALTGAFVGADSDQLGVIGVAMFSLPFILMRFTIDFSAKKNQNAIETFEKATRGLEKAHAEKTKTLDQLIETVSNIIDARDNLVWGHSRNVADYAVLLGGELSLPEEELSLVHSAGLLHDLGKVAIPEHILHKPGRLTDDEFAIVKEHPITGKRILAGVEMLDRVALMIGDHHERYDGNGYPHRKEADEISIGGRILAVADTLDSILSDRSYSKARSLAEAIAEINRCAGGQFDPDVVAALHRVVAKKGTEYFGNSARNTLVHDTSPITADVIPFPRRAN